MFDKNDRDALEAQAEYEEFIHSRPELERVYQSNMKAAMRVAKYLGISNNDDDLRVLLNLTVTRSMIFTIKTELTK